MFDFSTILRTLGGSLAGIFMLVSGCLTAVAGTGCTFHMHGSGESGLGYRSESKVFAYHHANEGNKAKATSSTELSQPASDWLFDKNGKPVPPAEEVTTTKSTKTTTETTAETVTPATTPMGVTTK